MSEIEVHIDLNGVVHRVGTLRVQARNGRTAVSFEYHPDWLALTAHFSLEPAGDRREYLIFLRINAIYWRGKIPSNFLFMKESLLQANLESLSISTDFPLQIEAIVREKGVSYIDSIEIWCDQNGKDILAGAELVKKSPIIREKIRVEAEDLNLLPKQSRLPL